MSSPRSGSTLLFETLRRHPELYSLGTESHAIIETNPSLSPPFNGFESNALTEKHATQDIQKRLRNAFESAVISFEGKRPQSTSEVRLLEKTPKNALRIPFLKSIFPDAKFVHLVREPYSNIASIMEAWLSGKFITYPFLPGWGAHWSLFLPPGWRKLKGAPLADVAAYQWAVANAEIIKGLDYGENGDAIIVNYQDLVNNPQAELERVAQFHQLTPHQFIENGENLPLSQFTLSVPSKDKWRKHEEALKQISLELDQVVDKINSTLLQQGRNLLTPAEL